jgi:Flp pilus assembly pilin Flp
MHSAGCAAERAGRRDETGATIVEFLSVAVLTVLALLGVAQMAMWTWARNVAVNAAHEGARTAAELGRPLDDGVARARMLLHDGLGRGADGFAIEAAEVGREVHVSARGEAPTVLPFMPRFVVTARAHAFDEDALTR